MTKPEYDSLTPDEQEKLCATVDAQVSIFLRHQIENSLNDLVNFFLSFRPIDEILLNNNLMKKEEIEDFYKYLHKQEHANDKFARKKNKHIEKVVTKVEKPPLKVNPAYKMVDGPLAIKVLWDKKFYIVRFEHSCEYLLDKLESYIKATINHFDSFLLSAFLEFKEESQTDYDMIQKKHSK